jgi:hypothetical protein
LNNDALKTPEKKNTEDFNPSPHIRTTTIGVELNSSKKINPMLTSEEIVAVATKNRFAKKKPLLNYSSAVAGGVI